MDGRDVCGIGYSFGMDMALLHHERLLSLLGYSLSGSLGRRLFAGI